MSCGHLFPLPNVDALHQQPDGHRQDSENQRQKKERGSPGRRQDEEEIPDHEPETTERHQSAQNPGKVARSKHQVPEENGRDSVEDHENPAAVSVQLERQQRESVQLIGRKGLQICSASEDERGCKIEELGGAENRGGHEPEEGSEQGKLLMD